MDYNVKTTHHAPDSTTNATTEFTPENAQSTPTVKSTIDTGNTAGTKTDSSTSKCNHEFKSCSESYLC